MKPLAPASNLRRQTDFSRGKGQRTEIGSCCLRRRGTRSFSTVSRLLLI